MNVGLFFGSFNPIHIGHLLIANYMICYSDLKEIWFVVSPHNPLKDKQTLLAEYHRYALVQTAIENDPRFRVSNIEFSMPKPSYTIDTLVYLEEKYPNYNFSIIMGADNINTIDKWKNYKILLNNYKILVYPRTNFTKNSLKKNPNILFTQAPIIEISSSFIRKAISENKDIRHFLPPAVWKYIDEMNFYKNKI